ncbi:hypothetical protein G9A89_010315 [Geosiphon pyriformis]|nr:hypothetical protein G9A89_010315 [Geosiphon pyriformis]
MGWDGMRTTASRARSLVIMRLKELEGILQNLTKFREPKSYLEQYTTTPHLAARMLFTAHSVYDDIENKVVADFGCGCGVLSIASNLLGSSFNLGIDIDPSALQIAQENSSNCELDIDFLLADITSYPLQRLEGDIDTVIMNPPFGTKNKGVDMIFLKKAMEVSNNAVYSLHKTSTREHVLKKAREWDVTCEILAELKFDIPMMYKVHKKSSVDIEVDLLRIVK